jgi:peptidylamidoglycolate lyase
VPTVLTLHPETGAVLSDWGRNLLYMPHGIALDAADNVWLTDVALHQVFKVRTPRFNGSRKFITVATRVRHWCIS